MKKTIFYYIIVSANPAFKYEYMRKHVFEHGRGDHSHCKECSFFEELKGKPPIRRTRDHLSSTNHTTEQVQVHFVRYRTNVHV